MPVPSVRATAGARTGSGQARHSPWRDGYRDHAPRKPRWRQWSGLTVIACLHGLAAAMFLGASPGRPLPEETAPIMVSFLPPAVPEPPAPPKPAAPVSAPKPATAQPSPPASPAPPLLAVAPASEPASTWTAPPPPAKAEPMPVPSTPQPAPPKTPPSPAPDEPAPITAPLFNAAYLRNPAPAYPPQARRLGEQGQVVLRVLVNDAGLAEQIELQTSSGSARLDQAALSTVRAWRFVPARRGDKPISAWVAVPIHFKLGE